MATNGPLTNETENAIFTALVECGKDHARKNNIAQEDMGIYGFLFETPLLVMTVALRLKLEDLGYKLTEDVSKIAGLVEIKEDGQPN